MHRIDTKTAQKDKFGAGKNGFTRGNPQTGTPATDLDDDYFDMLQEELCSVVEASGASLEKGRHDQLLTALRALLLNLGLGEGSALPVGVPVPWPSATPPTGWLKCNGAAFSAEEYPELAKAYPTNKLPDLRGEFIRGWDDERGVDSGRTLLSSQGDAIRNITGGFGQLRVNSEINAIVDVQSVSGAFYGGTSVRNNINVSMTYANDRKIRQDVHFSAANVVPTANENRPRNIAFNYIVRAA